MIQSRPDTLEFQILDVFTTERYRGNPLAVVRLKDTDTISQEQKLAITNEFNLSETVFIYPVKGDEGQYGADIFTVGSELPWAGHPTIGSAYVIAHEIGGTNSTGQLVTKAGTVALDFSRETDGKFRSASAVVPANTHLHACSLTAEAVRVLQPVLKSVDLVYDSFAVMSIANGMNFALIELPSVEILSKLSPSSGQTPADFVQLDPGWKDTLIGAYFYVCIEEDGLKQAKLHSRMFLGLIEDPATGSAASALAAYLALHVDITAPVRDDYQWAFEVEQGLDVSTSFYHSAIFSHAVQMGRKSTIGVTVHRTGEQSQIRLSGSCVEVMKGTLTL